VKRNRIWLAALALAIVAVAAAALVWRTQPVKVSLVQARIGPAVELVYATGFVEARQPVSVQGRITAPVAKVLVAEGDRVSRSQPLFLLADEEQSALLAQASAQRRAAEQIEARTVKLLHDGWVTRAARDQAVANADAARAGVRTALARQDQLIVRAQIDGIVTKLDIYPGELASPSRVLAQLGDPAQIRITATVDERDITRVRVGQPALMSSDAWPGRTINAAVAELTPTGDPTQRAFRVRLAPQSGADLPLGISLEVNIVTRREERAVLVPASAYADGHVWVVTSSRAARRAVKAGIKGAENVQIVSGLAAGETVIAVPPKGLAEGARVEPAK
jgi:RND family efflux transporter MFP subunit